MREKLADNPAALFWYAGSVPTEEAVSILRAGLKDGTWRKAPDDWFIVAVNVARRGDPTWTAIHATAELTAALTEGKVTDQPEVHRRFPEMFGSLLEARDAATLEVLVGWFIRTATASDSKLAAQTLWMRANRATDGLAAPYVKLMRWLLEVGAAELCRSDWAGLLGDCLVMAHAHAPELLGPILQFVDANEDPKGASRAAGRGDEQGPWALWSALEEALVRGASESLVSRVIARLVREMPHKLVAEPWTRSDLPRLGRALLRALVLGRLPIISSTVWNSVFYWCAPAPELGPEMTQQVLEAGLDQLVGHRFRHGVLGPDPEGEPRFLTSWTELLMSELMRRHDLEAILVSPNVKPERPEDHTLRRRLWSVAGWKEVQEGMRAALCGYVGRLEESASKQVVADLLATKGDDSFLLRAAILALPGPAPKKRQVDAARLEELQSWCEQLLNRPWHAPVYGVTLRKIIGTAQRLTLETLSEEDKVRVGPDTVAVDNGTFEKISSNPDAGRRRALAAMYLFHELVHVHQGIGDKDIVARLRATGGETTLLHLDLAADHVAASLLSAAHPQWSLASLKDVQGKSLSAFPARWMHPFAARGRKAIRVVSLRADYLARQGDSPFKDDLGDGYVFVDHAPAGGELVWLASGPPVRVLAVFPLPRADAVLLSSAADDGPPPGFIDELDRVLVRLAKMRP